MQLSKNNVRKMQRVRVSVLCGHGGVGGKGGYTMSTGSQPTQPQRQKQPQRKEHREYRILRTQKNLHIHGWNQLVLEVRLQTDFHSCSSKLLLSSWGGCGGGGFSNKLHKLHSCFPFYCKHWNANLCKHENGRKVGVVGDVREALKVQSAVPTSYQRRKHSRSSTFVTVLFLICFRDVEVGESHYSLLIH